MKHTMRYIMDIRMVTALCVALIFLSGGCSTGSWLKDAETGKKWTCDIAADNALMNRDFKTAILSHEDLLKKEPLNGLAMYHLGYAYGQIGNHEEEIHYYEMAVDHGFFKNGIFFNLGMTYGDLNLIEKAIGTFKKGIEIEPDNSDNHFGLAIAYRKNASNTLAEKEFLKAIELNPEGIEARIHLGMLYLDTGKITEAGEQFKKVLESDPDNLMIQDLLQNIEKR